MAKVAVLIANDTIADGKARRGGQIDNLEEDTAAVLYQRGAGRAATDDEIARISISRDPVEGPGELPATPVPAPAEAPAPAPAPTSKPAFLRAGADSETER